jgi:hypothetical protein
MDHEGIDLLRQPASKGALEKWEAYLSRTKVSSWPKGHSLAREKIADMCPRTRSVVEGRSPSWSS